MRGSATSPEEELDMSRYIEAIRFQLESVGEWQAEIFVMRHMQDLSIKEISERTARSSDSIRSSLYRVKRLLVESEKPIKMLSSEAGFGTVVNMHNMFKRYTGMTPAVYRDTHGGRKRW